jgi:predicted component of type VI protein secretion system
MDEDISVFLYGFILPHSEEESHSFCTNLTNYTHILSSPKHIARRLNQFLCWSFRFTVRMAPFKAMAWSTILALRGW